MGYERHPQSSPYGQTKGQLHGTCDPVVKPTSANGARGVASLLELDSGVRCYQSVVIV